MLDFLQFYRGVRLDPKTSKLMTKIFGDLNIHGPLDWSKEGNLFINAMAQSKIRIKSSKKLTICKLRSTRVFSSNCNIQLELV